MFVAKCNMFTKEGNGSYLRYAHILCSLYDNITLKEADVLVEFENTSA